MRSCVTPSRPSLLTAPSHDSVWITWTADGTHPAAQFRVLQALERDGLQPAVATFSSTIGLLAQITGLHAGRSYRFAVECVDGGAASLGVVPSAPRG